MLNLWNRLRAFLARKNRPEFIGTYGRESFYLPKGTRVVPVPLMSRDVTIGEVRIVVHESVKNPEELIREIRRSVSETLGGTADNEAPDAS